ncbi:CPBP family intramembrane glutamic endopeptidase [Actinomyces capricornis]|uniref:Transporter n=1 Tax=Actinomyces capricornis TaxID=2755559 RepID=A0ABN6K3F0_9ACTO|nr:CPBP family intramembrane glutamic endopeptidase [Actinomyces capricornis]BDA64127.1 transporter [Actinomyces capricornis]
MSRIEGASIWRLLGLPLLVSLVVLVVLPATGLLLTPILGGGVEEPISLSNGVGMWVALIGGGLLMIRASRLSWSGLGFIRQGWPRALATGALLGAGLLTLVALVIWMLGGTRIEYAFTASALGPIAVAVFFFAAQGTWEELVYRGYLMPHLSRLWGDKASIIVTSLFFTAFHAANPGLTFMPILNLTVFGFVFALLYYRTGNMWLTGASHAVWNFSQGFIFGSEVSGNAASASVLRSTGVPGRDLLSGGPFGFEGSIVTTIAGILIIAGLVFLWPKRTAAAA